MKTMIVTVLAMLAVTCFADQQADYIKQIRESSPTADFSQMDENVLEMLAEADAMVYFKDHKDVDWIKAGEVGKAHAYKHHLIGSAANSYSVQFLSTFDALQGGE